MMYYFEDRDIEEAMLKSCLLFGNKKIKDTRNNLFQKYLLSIIINGAKSEVDIRNYIGRFNKEYIVDNGKIHSTILELKRNGLIEIEGDEISLMSSMNDVATDGVDSIIKKLDILVDEIFEKVRIDYCKYINNSEQVKLNIKECINYYFIVSSLSFFNIDNKKEIETLERIEQIAANNLKGDEKEILSNIIISVIGSVINKPSVEQYDVLEYLARTCITRQIMGIDPLLSNFKASIISTKEFILDTDVVLYAITDNALYSRQYKMMIKQLISCGCKIYLPEEVIREVYNHAEAAKSKYHFVSKLMDNDDDWVRNEFKNIFVEDYYITRLKTPNKKRNWDTYISNFYDSQYDLLFTLSQIKEKLGDKILYNKMPDGGLLDSAEYETLSAVTLEETYKTEKAFHRESDKNREIAQTDAKLYLTIKKLNTQNNERNGKASSTSAYSLLGDRYYILTDSVRVHFCAKRLNLDSNVLCKPSALIVYLSEIGIITKDDLKITSLFDNPFLLHTSRIVWDDVRVLIDNGVDVRGKNIVRLRFDLQTEIRDLLSVETDKDYIDIYDRVSQKGYSYEPYVKSVIDSSKENKSRIEELEEKLRATEEQLAISQKKLARGKYESRVKNKTLKKNVKQR